MNKMNKADEGTVSQTKFDKVAAEIAELQNKKNADYGDTCLKLYKQYGMTYFEIMLDQKLLRMKQVAADGSNYESLEDTIMDIIGYGMHALLALREQEE